MRLINAPLNAASRTIAQFLSDSKNPVRATSCGFESHLRHNTKALQKDKNFEQSEGIRVSVLTPSTPISTPTRYDRASSIALAAFAGAAHNVCFRERCLRMAEVTSSSLVRSTPKISCFAG